ncbi:DUF4296 domain-containing protein [Thermonema rossianum]|jgi:hypothetical protein|uniref:DUF4296 domain-containing protein n=1 Tax=Thermonema rossianum TaxID=55505 RepID=UPI00056FB4A8|nr:DUF4296 domain-containing protein [Thermonema rossianum]
MHKIKLFFILQVGIIALSGCNTPKQSQQKAFEALDDTSMIRLLIDLHTLDATVPYLFSRPNNDTAKAVFKALREELFAKYHTDSAHFYQTYYYYLEHDISHINQIYSAVVDSLNLRANTKQFDLWQIEKEITPQQNTSSATKEREPSDSLLRKKIEKIKKKAISIPKETTTR